MQQLCCFKCLAVPTGLSYRWQVSALKGANEGLAKVLTAELAPSIRVNCILCPAAPTTRVAAPFKKKQKKEVNARALPLKKIGKVEDMAEFFNSEKVSWITGQTLYANEEMSCLNR